MPAGRPKGSKTKISGAGLYDLLPTAKFVLKRALESDVEMVRLDAAKTILRYTVQEPPKLQQVTGLDGDPITLQIYLPAKDV